MATFSSIFSPAGSGDVSAALAATTASAEIVMNKNAIFAINATGDFTVAFGNSGMSAPTSANFRIPAGVIASYDLGDSFDRIRIFNLTAGSITYYIQQLVRNA